MGTDLLFMVKQPQEADKGLFMEMHELVSDVNVLYVLSVTGLAP